MYVKCTQTPLHAVMHLTPYNLLLIQGLGYYMVAWVLSIHPKLPRILKQGQNNGKNPGQLTPYYKINE